MASALSVDYILQGDIPLYIDCNPRLVEPTSAFFTGLDLTDLLLRVSLDKGYQGRGEEPFWCKRPAVFATAATIDVAPPPRTRQRLMIAAGSSTLGQRLLARLTAKEAQRLLVNFAHAFVDGRM